MPKKLHFELSSIMLIVFSLGLASSTAFAAIESESVTVHKEDLLYSLEPLSENQIIECESLFEDYSSLEENVFNQRYLYHKFAGNCVMLFDDDLWAYEGEDRTQKLMEQSEKHIMDRESQKKHKETSMFVEINSVLPLQIPQTYLVTFEGCTGFDPIHADDIHVASDLDVVLVVDYAEKDRIIPPGTCGTLEAQIKAEDPDSIRVLILGEEVSYKGMEKEDPETMKATPTLQETERFETAAIRYVDLAYMVEELSTSEIQDCERTYGDYVSLNEEEFSERYLYHSFMGNCVMLFEDPNWNKQTAFRYQELSTISLKLAEEREESLEIQKPTGAQVNPQSVKELEDGLYLYSFEGCTGSSPFKLRDILVASDMEVFSIIPPERIGHVFPPEFCTGMEARINAEDPDSIRAIIQGMPTEEKTQHLSPKAQVMQGTSPSDVVCKDGLDLIFKKSDGSPACVSPNAFEKLVSRGWGMPP